MGLSRPLSLAPYASSTDWNPLEAQTSGERHLETVFLQEQLQSFRDDVRVGGSDGDAFGIDDLQAVYQPVALCRRRPPSGFRDLLDEFLVELRAFVKGERGA